jgi:hypothetical protein
MPLRMEEIKNWEILAKSTPSPNLTYRFWTEIQTPMYSGPAFLNLFFFRRDQVN